MVESEAELTVMEAKPDSKKEIKNERRKKKKMMQKQTTKKEYELIMNFEELPDYMKENEYIRGYYRAEWPISRALLSLFSWHNETLNIWSHLVGFFLFVAFAVLNLSSHHIVPAGVAEFIGHLSWSIPSSAVQNVSSNLGNFWQGAAALIKLPLSSPMITSTESPDSQPAEPAVRWPFFVFLCGSMFCLLSSSSCHLLCCHSHRLNIFLLRLDYAGIAVMIITSFFPPIYYIFQCEPHWQITYLVVISAMGLITVFTLLSPQLSTGKFRAYRAMLFVSMALFGIVPAVHAMIVNWGEPRRNISLAYEAAMALSYLTGTAFYVSRVPERWRPGWFDLIGQSHQIFHCFVIAGALAHYGATLVFLKWRDEVGCRA